MIKTNKLLSFREDIDDLDQQLIKLLAQRIKVVKKIGEEKKKIGKETVDPSRKNAVLEKWLEHAKEKGLSTEFIRKIYATIHEYAVEVQNKNRE